MEKRLHKAAVEGNVELLRELHEEDSLLLHRVTVGHETPLHVATLLGHIEFVQEALFLNPELAEALDIRRSSPLHLASAKGYVEIVQALVSARPDMCAALDRDSLNPLHLAAMKGKVEALRELVRVRPQAARATVDQLGGETILHLCVKYHQMEALSLLVETLDDQRLINAKDAYGNTILHLAVADKQIKTVRYLLSGDRVDVNATNANGYTALDILAQSRRDVQDWDIGKALAEAGASNAVQGVESGHDISQGDWLKKKRDALMVVASLLATMAFQAGVSPPGGVWQDNSTDKTYRAGEAVVAYNYPQTYKFYLRANTIGFVASLSIILLLITGIPYKRKHFMWFLIMIMWLSITSMAFTYAYSVVAVTPKKDRGALRRTMYIAVPVWCGVMALLLLGHIIRWIDNRLKRRGMDIWKPFQRCWKPVKRCWKSVSENHGNGNQHVQIKRKAPVCLLCESHIG